MAEGTKKTISNRKAKLALPPIELTAETALSPPWNEDNIEEYLFRRVIVTGRPIHARGINIPHRLELYDGYENVVPLVIKEDDKGNNR